MYRLFTNEENSVIFKLSETRDAYARHYRLFKRITRVCWISSLSMLVMTLLKCRSNKNSWVAIRFR
jgi:hypothetical protein